MPCTGDIHEDHQVQNVVGGIPALWSIGQVAVWQPARKAAAVSPLWLLELCDW